MRKLLLAYVAAIAFVPVAALAQSSPGFYYNQQPTYQQWNSYFSAKQDYSALLGGIAGLTPTNGQCIQGNGAAFVLGACGGVGVSSFNSRTGAVVPASGDYTVSQITGAAPLASPTFTGTVTIPNGAALGTPASGVITNLTGTCAACVANSATLDLPLAGGTLTGALLDNLNGTTPQAAQAGTVIRVANANGTGTRFEADSYAATGYFSSVRADGTAASPTTLQAADEMGGYNAWGYNGTAFAGPSGAFRIYANQNWTSGAQGTYADVATTPNGSTTEAEIIKFQNDGGITTPAQTDEGAGTINAAGLYVAGVPTVTSSSTNTFTNKSISGLTNTLTGVPSASLTTSIEAKTTSYTLAGSDGGNIVSMNDASASTLTVPSAATLGNNFGTDLYNAGTGTETVSGTFDTVSSIPLVQGQDAFPWSDGTTNHVYVSMPPVASHSILADSGGSAAYPISTTNTDITALLAGNVALTNAANYFSTGSQSNCITTLSISTTTFTPDGSCNNYIIILTSACASAACTLANFSTIPSGSASGWIKVVQPASGGPAAFGTYGSYYIYGGGTSTITYSTGANDIDLWSYAFLDSTHIQLVQGALNAFH